MENLEEILKWKKKLSTRLQRKSFTNDKGCIIWTGTILKTGYGTTSASNKTIYVHRLAFILKHGYIPNILDHGNHCSNRRCINPNHLTDTDSQGNSDTRIKIERTHCDKGHELTEDNIYWKTNGTYKYKTCKTCYNARERFYDNLKRLKPLG